MRKFLSLSVPALLLVSSFLSLADAERKKFEWEGNKLGLDRSVPKPWIPIRMNGDKISVWGRKMDFKNSLFPAEITSQKQKLLAEPISVHYVIDGKEHTIGKAQTGIKEKSPDRVLLTSFAADKNLKISTNTLVEFDGFMKFDVDVQPQENSKIEHLWIDIVFPRSIAEFYMISETMVRMYSPKAVLNTWGRIKKSRKMPLSYEIIISNEDVGLAWICESVKGWFRERKDRTQEIIVDGNKVKFRLNIIDSVGGGSSVPRKFTFALMPMPTRSMPKGWRKQVISSDNRGAFLRQKELGGRDKADFTCVEISLKGKHTGWAVPVPADLEAHKQKLKKYHDAGMKLIPYCNPSVLYRGTEEWKVFEDEWRGGPDRGSEGKFEIGKCNVNSSSQSWQNYYIYKVVDAVKKYGYDGVYFDIIDPHEDKNPAHKDHHFVSESGEMWYIKPYFARREFLKRIYKALKKINPDSVIIYHPGCSPFFPFCDIYTWGEAINRFTDSMKYTDIFTEEDIGNPRISGKQLGVPYIMLPQLHSKASRENPAYYRAFLAFSLLNDYRIWYSYMNQKAATKAHKILFDFGIDKAEYISPLKVEKYVSTDSALKVALYVRKKEEKLLMIIANLTKKDIENGDMAVIMTRLFKTEKPVFKAYDAETGKEIPFQFSAVEEARVGYFNILVKKENFRMVLIEKKGGKK